MPRLCGVVVLDGDPWDPKPPKRVWLRPPERGQIHAVSPERTAIVVEKLLEFGIVRTVADGRRYRLNLESPVTRELCELNSAVNAVGDGHVRIDPETGAVELTDG